MLCRQNLTIHRYNTILNPPYFVLTRGSILMITSTATEHFRANSIGNKRGLLAIGERNC